MSFGRGMCGLDAGTLAVNNPCYKTENAKTLWKLNGRPSTDDTLQPAAINHSIRSENKNKKYKSTMCIWYMVYPQLVTGSWILPIGS